MIAHLKVQGGVLIQVALGGVLLRPEHRAHLIHPLEHPHHGLLVELGGLGQEGLFAKVVQAENVGASLRPGVDDLGCVDLGEAPGSGGSPGRPGRYPPGCVNTALLPGHPQHYRPQTQLGVQVQVQLPLGQGHRHGGCRTGEDGDLGVGQLPAAGCPGLVTPRTGGGDRAALHCIVQVRLVGTHTLDQAFPGAQGEEGDAAHVPQGMDRAVQGDDLVIPALHRCFSLFGQEYHTVHNLS